jgi:hypothetical protein
VIEMNRLFRRRFTASMVPRLPTDLHSGAIRANLPYLTGSFPRL